MIFSREFVHQRIFILLLFAAVAALILSPISSNLTAPNIAEYYSHIAAIVQAKMALSEGQFPLRTMPLQAEGLRYPYFQFYSPSSHFFAAIVYRWLTPANPWQAYKFVVWCSLIAGGIYLYRLAFWLVKSMPAALLAGVVYITSPYYIILVDHLGSFTEVCGLGILPAVLFYTLKRFHYPTQNKIFLPVTMAWYLLATTDLITFFYASVFIAVLLTLAVLKDSEYLGNLVAVLLAYTFACLLAMWFFAPIVSTGKYLAAAAHPNPLAAFYSYRPSFFTLTSPTQIYFMREGDTLPAFQQVHASLGLPLLMGVGICLYVLLNKKNKETRPPQFWLMPLFILFLLVFFMMWSPFNVWQWLPQTMRMGHSSLRLMGQSIWIGALLFAFAMVWLFKNELNVRQAVIGIFILIFSTSAWYAMPETNLRPLDMRAMLAKPLMLQNADFLVQDKNNKKIADAAVILPLEAVRPHCQQQKDFTVCEIKTITETVIQLPIFYYPELLNITLNGKKVLYDSMINKNNLIAVIKVKPASLNVIKMKFSGFWWANWISRAAFLIWLLTLVNVTRQTIMKRS